MRLRKDKRKTQGMPPAQVEALGRFSSEDFRHIHEKLRAVAEGATGAQSDPAPLGGNPLLIGGETTGDAQGGKLRPEFPGYSDSIVLNRSGEPVILPGVRPIKGEKVGIDWVSVVFRLSETYLYDFVRAASFGTEIVEEDGLLWLANQKTQLEEMAELVHDMFAFLLGLEIDKEAKRPVYQNGLNGYSYAMGLPHQAGIVHVGHRSGTTLVAISGVGCRMAAPGWEYRLKDFIELHHGWLTRLDFAFDDYDGLYFPVRRMREAAREGKLQRHEGRPAKIELRGAWEQDDPDNKGLTLYIGTRLSGKQCRIYEKGKHLGEGGESWVRAEVELHSSAFQLTVDMLVHPTKYFAAFYPIFEEKLESVPDRTEVEYRKRIAQATVNASIRTVRHQFGGHLAGLRQLYSDSELLDMLVRTDSIPAHFIQAEIGLRNSAPSASLTDEPGILQASEK